MVNGKAIAFAKAVIRKNRTKGLPGSKILNALQCYYWRAGNIVIALESESYEVTLDNKGKITEVSNQPTEKMIKAMDISHDVIMGRQSPAY